MGSRGFTVAVLAGVAAILVAGTAAWKVNWKDIAGRLGSYRVSKVGDTLTEDEIQARVQHGVAEVNRLIAKINGGYGQVTLSSRHGFGDRKPSQWVGDTPPMTPREKLPVGITLGVPPDGRFPRSRH